MEWSGEGAYSTPLHPLRALGMAIGDFYYLARSLNCVDLRDARAVNAGLEMIERYRVDYVSHNVEFARFLGKILHNLPYPLS
jgi:hypothetical protein